MQLSQFVSSSRSCRLLQLLRAVVMTKLRGLSLSLCPLVSAILWRDTHIYIPVVGIQVSPEAPSLLRQSCCRYTASCCRYKAVWLRCVGRGRLRVTPDRAIRGGEMGVEEGRGCTAGCLASSRCAVARLRFLSHCILQHMHAYHRKPLHHEPDDCFFQKVRFRQTC
jgi:hypothetical protein